MASSSPGTPKLKKKNLPKIEATVYSGIPLTEQVVFAIHFLEQHGVAVTVEEVVSTCFRLFPQSFSLKHYTRWPDSALVIRRLNDARERGFVKGHPHEGFALKYSGLKLAERIAKLLGLVKPAPVKKKTAHRKPKAGKTQSVQEAKKAAVKEAAPKKQATMPPVIKASSKVSASKQVVEQKSVTPKKAVMKTAVQVSAVKKSPAKAQPAKTKISKKIAKPRLAASKKVVEKKPKESSIVQKAAPAKPIAQPVQKPVVKKKSAPVPQLTKLQAIQPEIMIPVKVAKPAPVTVFSKEEKQKAERIVRAMERSDAYKLYSKNGNKAKPSEFDFRNMLFATMESTPETLVRNVNLFKGSAAIHNRQDLIKFLDDCEANFAELLKPSVKKVLKKR